MQSTVPSSKSRNSHPYQALKIVMALHPALCFSAQGWGCSVNTCQGPGISCGPQLCWKDAKTLCHSFLLSSPGNLQWGGWFSASLCYVGGAVLGLSRSLHPSGSSKSPSCTGHSLCSSSPQRWEGLTAAGPDGAGSQDEEGGRCQRLSGRRIGQGPEAHALVLQPLQGSTRAAESHSSPSGVDINPYSLVYVHSQTAMHQFSRHSDQRHEFLKPARSPALALPQCLHL